jgi:hypothetical protein
MIVKRHGYHSQGGFPGHSWRHTLVRISIPFAGSRVAGDHIFANNEAQPDPEALAASSAG